ncbi:hypothetical protein PV08_02992 [Exophiala spinifera]|uniref:XRCC4 coiled-coil domain-containing protein n=1 Tax=Exophiala spinifera TaxID=91928 RepID=A0A0D2BIB5_9EURO|nr:uncharacterized protein PV08_02992 [Exophiala spinifera]KIW18703.1 hypothetical protein PV08_02992 [Exophiala spinifera]
MASWVIRLTKADREKTPLLVRVSQKEGGHDLDLDLLATDGDAAYLGKVRQRNLKKLRAKAYDGSDDDWTAVLSYLFRCKSGRSLTATEKTSLEVKCSVSGKDPRSTLTISLLNKIEDITQQLGAIELPQTEDTDEIDLFGWAVQVVDERDELENSTEEFQEKAKAKDDIVAALQEQIDELVKTKAEHEQQLLAKFAALLNEKKLKIRNMQRVLTTAQADPTKLKEIRARQRDAAPSRTRRGTKRRAQQEETEESDDFENMDVDDVVNNPDEPVSPESGHSTPSPEPDETASEDEDEDVPPSSHLRSRTGGKESTKGETPITLPPRRELPFASQATGKGKEVTNRPERAPAPVASANEEDEETASEDDEL